MSRAFPLLAIGTLLVLTSSRRAEAADFELQPGTKVELAKKEDAAKLLSTRDGFVEAMSPYDRAARLKSDKETTEKAYLEFVAEQAASFTDDEKKRVTDVLDGLKPKLAPLKLSFPPLIRILKTTGKEEGGAAYCRGASIVLPEKLLEKGSSLESVLPHEIFHVYSTHNAKRREALYAVVGFKPCAAVSLPDSIAKRKITNPDAFGLDYAIEIEHGKERLLAVPVLYAKSETVDPKGEFFDDMETRLLVVKKKDGKVEPVLESGEPRLLKMELEPDYVKKVGKNTAYIIHPEEVLADNFVFLLDGKKDLPSPKIVEGLKKVLAEAATK